MSTAIDYHHSPGSPPNIRSRHHFSNNPTNDDLDNPVDGIELGDLNELPPPPAYTERAAETISPTSTSTTTTTTQHDQTPSPTSSPTLSLQIETTGKPILSLPVPPHPDPIPIYLVDPSNPIAAATETTTPKFVSFRPYRGSGSCYLVSGDALSSSSAAANTQSPPLSTTIYRFGPGRPPRVRIFHPYHHPSDSAIDPQLPYLELDDSAAYSSFDILSSGLLTRAVRFKPPRLLDDDSSSSPDAPSSSAYPGGGGSGGGSRTSEERQITEQFFEWRYAGRKERRTYSSTATFSNTTGDKNGGIDSLLILSKTTIFTKRPHHPDQAGTTSSSNSMLPRLKTTTTVVETIPIARLVRSAALRTKGSTPSCAGNGGRLEILDLDGAGYPETDKSRREMVLVMIVTTCLVMLKREVDRRRAQQIAVLSGAVAG